MPIPPNLAALVDRLNQELNSIEQDTLEGLSLTRLALSRFSNDAILIQYFAYLNSALLFVETFKSQVQITVEFISQDNVDNRDIQESGEDLSTLLGTVIETKLGVQQILNLLNNLL
jgi:hypothetical protein